MSGGTSKPFNEWKTILSNDAYSECALAAQLEWDTKEQTRPLTVNRDGSMKDVLNIKNTIHTKGDKFYHDLLVRKMSSSSSVHSVEDIEQKYTYTKTKGLLSKKKQPDTIIRAE